VADYTLTLMLMLMLMLMAVRNAKSVILRADIHDYRLSDIRGPPGPGKLRIAR
jgi:D-specific alpha-keto acid dehydrogenase